MEIYCVKMLPIGGNVMGYKKDLVEILQILSIPGYVGASDSKTIGKLVFNM